MVDRELLRLSGDRALAGHCHGEAKLGFDLQRMVWCMANNKYCESGMMWLKLTGTSGRTWRKR